MTTRRAFLSMTAAGWSATSLRDERHTIDGHIVGASSRVGHQLRGPIDRSRIDGVTRADVVVIGSGPSGLSAAWRLAPHDVEVHVLELESFIGGTSSYGDDGNGVVYPWGAHYLPAPNRGARATNKLLEEMGVIRDWDARGDPIFDGRVLCHAPDERLFYEGAWHPSLVPHDALSRAELDELARFQERMQAFEDAIGSDGRAPFSIPVDDSSRDPAYVDLDRISMAAFLEREGFRSRFLQWHVRYAMLDDFGAEPSEVSAWAGVHYFASRTLQTPQLEGSHYLVWPEGNGRLVEELRRRSKARIHSGALVVAVDPAPSGVRVVYLETTTSSLRAIDARAAVIATPAFIAKRIAPFAAKQLPIRDSSPWVVANLHVTRGYEPNSAWDSVLFDAKGLGYVDASHQRTAPTKRTVLTYFRAYGDASPSNARAALLEANWDDLAREVFADLRSAHPELHRSTERMDVMVWGHAMPRPTPGFLGRGDFARMRTLAPRITYGHVDLSGLALFEEAQRAGVLAAEIALRDAGIDGGETWT
jgi:glycine/D-amino acid oxidase-like deaminating enzyme